MRAALHRVRNLLAWTLPAAALAAGPADGATGTDPYYIQASQSQIAELTSISATVGPTGVVSYSFAGYHPAISGVVFTGKGGWDPKTKRASEELDFPQGKIRSSTTCPADPWSEGQPCAALGAGGSASATIGAPFDLALLPWGPPVGAMLLSPASHLKAKAAYAEGLRNRPTATPTHTPVPRFALRSGGSGAREIVIPTPTPAGHLARAAAPAGIGITSHPALNTPTYTPTHTPAHASTLTPPQAQTILVPTRTPTHTPGPSGGASRPGTAATARLPLSAAAALFNEAMQGTLLRFHNAARGGGYANDSYVAPGPRLGGARIPVTLPAPTFQAGTFQSTLFVNDVNSNGITVAPAGDKIAVTLTFESAGPELLVRGPVSLDVEADNGRAVLTLTPGLDASGRPSFSTLDADMTAAIRCTAPNQILAGICNSVEPFAATFLRTQAAAGLRQTLSTADFRNRVGAAMRALLEAPAGKAEIEKATGQKIGTIKATRFEAGGVLAIDHD